MAVARISATEMAEAVGVDPKAFTAALRAAQLEWHHSKASWTVKRDSQQHEEMKTILANLLKEMREARRT